MCPWSWYIATTASNSPPAARLNTESGGRGPTAPSPTVSATAGAISLASSEPKRPFSPACGLRPATAIRGLSMPNSVRASCTSLTTVTTRSFLTALIASKRDTWVEMWATRKSPSMSSIAYSVVLVKWAYISVWPGNLCPARLSASLLRGAVAVASMRPALASSIARRTDSKARSPQTADTFP
jgi:hypothetical protein